MLFLLPEKPLEEIILHSIYNTLYDIACSGKSFALKEVASHSFLGLVLRIGTTSLLEISFRKYSISSCAVSLF